MMSNQTPSPFSRRAFLAASLAAGIGAQRFARGQQAASTRRPNIVFLLTDDQRWDTLGCVGNPIIQTPAIDAMAREGVLFRNTFITTPICCASRASIFTGLYSTAHQLERFDAPLSEEQFALSYPGQLREAGYHLGFIGKWGLGGDMPEDRFDYWRGFPGQGDYFPDPDNPSRHLTAIMGEQSEDYLRNVPEDRPFCLSVSFKAPHVQDQDPRQFLYDPALEDLYRDVTFEWPETAAEELYRALPERVQASESRRRWEIRFATEELFQRSMRGYYRLITGVDRAVARIRRVLEEQGLADNTIIVFSSDNGFYLGDRGLAGKWYGHEESIRVPLVIYDPRLPASQRGAEREEMVLNIDWAPTLLEWAGLPIPEAMQGTSLVPLVQGDSPAWREDWFFEHRFGHHREPPIPASEGVRTQRWKYLRYLDTDPLFEELYNLEADPLETQNLARDPAHAPDLEAMRNRWQTWKDNLAAWSL